MPLDGTRLGDKIADDIRAFGITAGTPITANQLRQIWEIVSRDNVSEIVTHADVLPMAHSGEDLSNPIGQPIDVTTGPGSGSTGATTAPQALEGKGSIT